MAADVPLDKVPPLHQALTGALIQACEVTGCLGGVTIAISPDGNVLVVAAMPGGSEAVGMMEALLTSALERVRAGAAHCVRDT
jgi:hypothetical protein